MSPFKSIKQSLMAGMRFDVSGRIGRLEFLWFVLFELFVFWLVASIADNPNILNVYTTNFIKYTLLLFLIFAIWVFIAGFMVMTRRWHDIGRSGWYNLLMCIPMFNTVVAVYLLVKPGNSGENQYGAIRS